jgi:UDP-N-acetylglucosamine acyltransferase
MDVAAVLDRLCHRYPVGLVDAVSVFEPGRRISAVKNVTINEEFFQGHFPEVPLMPGVLLIESLTQAATLLLLYDGEQVRNARTVLRRVTGTKFRRQVTPGDQVTLDIELRRRRGPIASLSAVASVGGQVAAEAELHVAVVEGAATIHPTAIVHPMAVLGGGTVIGPNATIGPHVRLGRNNRVGASCVIDGHAEFGDDNVLFPFGSFGMAPQDMKYKGEPTRLVVGNGNTFREFVTIHRGTAGGGGTTDIGDNNVFMAYAHVAHDCHIGNFTIFGNAATLGGHVTVEDYATISAFSGVHQFCRVGQHAFIGGYSVVTKDALPYAKTVGNRARIYGINTIGLERRKFSKDSINQLRKAFRYLLHSNTSRALAQIDRDPSLGCAEVQYLLHFIRSSSRGVGLRRPSRRLEEVMEE